MTIKVYHNLDGSVSITKVAPSGLEQPICSKVVEGKVVTIDVVVANLASEISVSNVPENFKL